MFKRDNYYITRWANEEGIFKQVEYDDYKVYVTNDNNWTCYELSLTKLVRLYMETVLKNVASDPEDEIAIILANVEECEGKEIVKKMILVTRNWIDDENKPEVQYNNILKIDFNSFVNGDDWIESNNLNADEITKLGSKISSLLLHTIPLNNSNPKRKR